MSEQQSAVVNQMEIESKMHIAYKGGLKTLAQLIPYLEYREHAARKYFESSNLLTTEERQAYIDMVNRINEDIIKIMGL